MDFYHTDPLTYSDSRMENHPIYGRIQRDERKWQIVKQEPFTPPADYMEKLRATIDRSKK